MRIPVRVAMAMAREGSTPNTSQPRRFSSSTQATGPGKLRLYWDGGCPLCRKEIAFYKKINEARNELDFHDLHSSGVDPLRTSSRAATHPNAQRNN